MTAKHRKGKNNHKHEDNFFKNDVIDSEVRAAGNNYTLALVLVLVVVLGGAIGAWFCFQQHQTLTYLTDNLMGIQMKIAKLQSSHEELRQSNGKKQVGMALATAEQLKTSDLPAQVLSLHTEMKTRLSEMQQATVSMEQLGHIQSIVQGNSAEFEGVRLKLEALTALGDGLSLKVEALQSNLGTAESKLTEQVATLSASLDGQAAEVLSLRERLEKPLSSLKTYSLLAEIEIEQAPEATETIVEEQLETVLEESIAEDLEQVEIPQEESTEEETTEEETIEEESSLTDEAPPAEPTEEEVVADVTEEEPAAPEELLEEEEATEELASAVENGIEGEPVHEEATENQENVQTEKVNTEDVLPEIEEAIAEEEPEKTDEVIEVEEPQEVEETQENVTKEAEEVLEQPAEADPEEVLETEEVTERRGETRVNSRGRRTSRGGFTSCGH
ncbi:hypothetical protein WMY93_011535 [Mugilogobius chulae]|uniref:Uncharacterized protein n=1 Tax=Mugilogobius chulae TaxID=88201 RepID=A0AAW0PBS7_9GOBI